MTTEASPRRRRQRHRVDHDAPARTIWPAGATLLLATLVLFLPLMMGHRTPMTLTASLALMVWLSLLAAFVASGPARLPLPPTSWLLFAGLFSLAVLLQIVPGTPLTQWFGPYPPALLQGDFQVRTWSPDPGASLRGWAAFIALFTVAWLTSQLPHRQRYALWLVVVAMALFQALYGLLSHATGAESIFGIWERNNPGFVHGSFSNRNLFAANLALCWPLAVGVWFIRGMPLIGRLPGELRLTGSIICGAIIGAAMLGSASRMGAAAGVFGMLVALMLWIRHQRQMTDASIWPFVLAMLAAMVAAWYGLMPLAERLLATSGEEARLETAIIMLRDMPSRWWLHGVGLGGFEAVFKQVQPADMGSWWDYAHNDLLQFVLEMGVVGIILIGMVGAAIWKNAALRMERIPLYAGLAALCVVGIGDFSWHIPATQLLLAMYIGVLARPAPRRGASE
ncbi:MAG: O-antigen ligase family protein [Wenzhouxiangella sp.]